MVKNWYGTHAYIEDKKWILCLIEIYDMFNNKICLLRDKSCNFVTNLTHLLLTPIWLLCLHKSGKSSNPLPEYSINFQIWKIACNQEKAPFQYFKRSRKWVKVKVGHKISAHVYGRMDFFFFTLIILAIDLNLSSLSFARFLNSLLQLLLLLAFLQFLLDFLLRALRLLGVLRQLRLERLVLLLCHVELLTDRLKLKKVIYFTSCKLKQWNKSILANLRWPTRPQPKSCNYFHAWCPL